MTSSSSRLVVAIAFLCLFVSQFCLTVAAVVDCPIAPSQPQDRRTNKSKLVIGAYNAEWLFLDAKSCPGTGCPWKNEQQAQQHFQDIAKAILELNADILSLEEVQDCDALQTLLDALPSDMGYLPYMIKGTDSATGQNVGVLTRIDPSVNLKRTEARADFPISGTQCGPTTAGSSGISKHYYTVFNVNGVRIMFLGMHLIAFPIDASRCNQREAQATVAQALITELKGDFDELVVLGDLNDYSGSVLDAANDKPNSRVLDWLSNPISGLKLTSVASYLNQSSRYTAWYDVNNNCQDSGGKEHTSIDHLLISPGLNAHVDQAWIEHSYNVSCTTFYSDHWPIAVSINV